jgi:predicted nucleotidyltransferase
MFDSENERLVAETIFDNPGREYHLRGLAEETGVSPSTVSRIVEKLEDEGIIDVERDLKMAIKAAENERFRKFKLSYNLWRLNETGMIEELQTETMPESIVLFGSYAHGEDRNGSDIDIAVVNGREPDIELSGYEEELNRKIAVQNIDLQEADQNFIETLANGIVLRGYLEI